MSEPTLPGITTIEAVLAADRLLEAFETGDPEFGRLFHEADRNELGAVAAYAVLAMKGLATATGIELAVVRQQTRLLVCQSLALVEENENRDD